MSWRLLLASLLLAVLLCAGCSSKDTSNNVPQANNPANDPKTGLPTPTPNPYGGPDLSNAVSFKLPNNSDYSGLSAVMPSAITPPLVGDPLVDMILSNGTSASASGTIRLAAEDAKGLQARDWSSFPGTSQNSSTNFDMIFADDQVVVRATGTLAGNVLSNGKIYYRVRQSSDPAPFPQYPKITACEQFTVTCYDSNGNPVDPKYCGETQPDEATPCRNYMSTSSSSVILLGTFQQTSYSSWAH